MLGRIRGQVRFKEPLSWHTSLRVGGPADVFIVAVDVDDVRRAMSFAERERLSVTILGSGAGILVQDRGVRGVVLQPGGCLGRVRFCGDEVMAGAGAQLSAVIKEAADLGLGGLEGLAGIPATIGGALVMRVATPEVSLIDFVSVVHLLFPDGSLGEIKPSVNGQDGEVWSLPPDAVVLAARLMLERHGCREARRTLRRQTAQRKLSTPLALASAGYVWKDDAGLSASRLVRRAGCLRLRVGRVEVSLKDPNFIVNRGTARAAEVLELMAQVEGRVRDRLGINLVRRVRVIGE